MHVHVQKCTCEALLWVYLNFYSPSSSHIPLSSEKRIKQWLKSKLQWKVWVSPLHLQPINHHHNSGSNNSLAARPERGKQGSLKGELILTDTWWTGGVGLGKTQSQLAPHKQLLSFISSEIPELTWSGRPKITLASAQATNLSAPSIHLSTAWFIPSSHQITSSHYIFTQNYITPTDRVFPHVELHIAFSPCSFIRLINLNCACQ